MVAGYVASYRGPSGDAEKMWARPGLTRGTLDTLHAIESSSELAYVVAEKANTPQLTGPARAVSIRAHYDIEAGLAAPTPKATSSGYHPPTSSPDVPSPYRCRYEKPCARRVRLPYPRHPRQRPWPPSRKPAARMPRWLPGSRTRPLIRRRDETGQAGRLRSRSSDRR